MAGNDASRELTVCLAIPTFRREQVLVDTVTHVLALAPAPSEILVVDQTPEHLPATATFLEARHEAGEIRWIKQSDPNLPAARNRALRETTCDIVLFLDDDVVPVHDLVARHRRNYQDPAVAAVAGRVTQAHGIPVPRRRRPWPRMLDYKYLRRDLDERVEGVATVPGCNHSVRREAILRLGGYDENFLGWAFREDSDFAIRLWQSGATIVHDPEAGITHLACPAGGCRIKDDSFRMAEWLISYPATYFACRHFFPGWRFWLEVGVLNIRKYILRRDNVFRPWRLPWALLAYLYACWRASTAAIGRASRPSP